MVYDSSAFVCFLWAIDTMMKNVTIPSLFLLELLNCAVFLKSYLAFLIKNF